MCIRDSLLGLIDDILDLNRGSAGALSLYTASLSLLDAVTEAVDSIRLHAKSRSVSLRKGDHLDVRVTADPMRLRQILDVYKRQEADRAGSRGEPRAGADRSAQHAHSAAGRDDRRAQAGTALEGAGFIDRANARLCGEGVVGRTANAEIAEDTEESLRKFRNLRLGSVNDKRTVESDR